MKKYSLLLLMLLNVPSYAQSSSSGMIQFSGSIVEPACEVSANKSISCYRNQKQQLNPKGVYKTTNTPLDATHQIMTINYN